MKGCGEPFTEAWGLLSVKGCGQPFTEAWGLLLVKGCGRRPFTEA